MVETATNAEEALAKAHCSPPDAILSDVLMGEVDGFGLCRKAREDERLASVPLILLSAHYGGHEDAELSARVGASRLVKRTPSFGAELAALRASLGQPLGTTTTQAPDAEEYEQHLRSNANQLIKLLSDANRAEARYRTLFDNAVDTITLLTPQGIILEANQRWRDVLGVDPATMVGQHIRDFAPPGEEAAHVETYHKDVADNATSRVVPLRGADGSILYMEFTLRTIELEGQPTVLSIGRDVTQQRRLEESLRQAQKIEAIGQLTGGIAHDFNNMLAAILGSVHFLLEDIAEGDPRRADVEEIRVAAERAADLTRQLLAFSRKQLLEPRVADLGTTVSGLEKMLHRVIGEDIEVSVVCADDLWSVRVDVGQIEQVVMNLVVNARDAMPAGGKLRIETANIVLGPKEVGHWGPLEQGDYVMLAVTDTGCGMSAETQKRVFEPFFTTKDVGRGTGLGLSTCYGIVHQSGGYIWLYSELGHGTTFKVFLPRVDSRPDSQPASVSEAAAGGAETILLVEDDAQVRVTVGRMLQTRGYHLLVARDGREAIEIAESYAGKIQLVLSDVIMPHAHGPDVVAKIQEDSPETRALFMSGYTDHAVLRSDVLRAGNFIQKPFAPQALAKKVREVLDA